MVISVRECMDSPSHRISARSYPETESRTGAITRPTRATTYRNLAGWLWSHPHVFKSSSSHGRLWLCVKEAGGRGRAPQRAGMQESTGSVGHTLSRIKPIAITTRPFSVFLNHISQAWVCLYLVVFVFVYLFIFFDEKYTCVCNSPI